MKIEITASEKALTSIAAALSIFAKNTQEKKIKEEVLNVTHQIVNQVILKNKGESVFEDTPLLMARPKTPERG